MKYWKLVVTTALATTMAFSPLASTFTVEAATLTGDNSLRIAGKDRYETSLEISREGWENGEAQTVVVATGSDFPDALAATPLASSYMSPLLLSRKDSLPSGFANELKRLGTKHVILVGGTVALSDNVKKQIQILGITTERISGKTRYETAVNIAKEVGVTDTLYVATGANFADSLSISSLAGYYEDPILLVPPTGIPTVVSDFIKANPVDLSLIIGGEKAVPSSVEDLFADPIRISGQTRYDTNKAFNDFALESGLMEDPSLMFIATGTNYPDALSGSAFASLFPSPIVLTAPKPTVASKTQVSEYETEDSFYLILGGEIAVSKDTLAKLFAK
ncbi:cell wall-binding repeat-containing protein [Paenisporosarcina sp. TG-14]|uniref:cell wall-binding repeat-containing protein n=1 Tax=Paenisporosarcina sp. TG-14 TaxID=1231057 RepID=UPI0002F735AE|nr:cell wall-binding repeat-containing protein [Paenisporosarcina sp. TG-14]